MILRSFKRVRPRCLADLACFLLVAVFVPVTFIFQVTVVLPELMELFGFGYYLLFFIFFIGVFILFNLISNMMACMLVDTSINIELLKPPLDPVQRISWHKCDDCQAEVPPRCRHCDICQICVLKRDHHCRFTGCCIGHYNYRYFFFFLLYLAIGSMISSIMGSIFICLHLDIYWHLSTLLTVFAPAVSLALNANWMSFYLLICELSLLSFCTTSLLLVYHSDIFKRGTVVKERGTSRWNLGLHGNSQMVLGKRMHITWLSPFIRSDLPHNGINWETKED
ncbi:uncharacterized protein Dwil_GK14088 [Drosophila willistoni]|uniref:Palmitoyltransferase n=1 Tax=Drosophila willistoni TaxID=7260 RepID=B4NLE0_DROWI|nr:probable palmitoyltransferase ZDHHC24 [Drosophila willistoni]EDW84343.1 uncharacterized protein Dwil_GK14088 [Drosophila willistoni]